MIKIILVKEISSGKQFPGFIIEGVDFYSIIRQHDDIPIFYPSKNNFGRHVIRIQNFHLDYTAMSLSRLCGSIQDGDDKVTIILEDRRKHDNKKRMGNMSIRKSFIRFGYVRYLGTSLDTSIYQFLNTLDIDPRPLLMKYLENAGNRKFLINE